jgi:hypothetical protein
MFEIAYLAEYGTGNVMSPRFQLLRPTGMPLLLLPPASMTFPPFFSFESWFYNPDFTKSDYSHFEE